MKVFHGVLVAFVLLIGITSVTAQDTPEMGSGKLAELLRFVPDNENARYSLSFGDYRAAYASRPLDIIPQDYPHFETLPNDVQELWVMSMPNAGMQFSYFAAYGDTPTAMGIDFFQIDQSITFGIPPDPGFLLRGQFDEAAIRTAYQARGFIESEVDGLPVWCSADGCDTGIEINVGAREIADLFGGELGRRFPRALADNLLISAIQEPTLNASIAAGVSGETSLADDPAYQAAVAALDGDHYLRAAQFISPSIFLEPNYSRIPSSASGDQFREFTERLRGGTEDLPVYDLVVMADIADAEKEYAVIGLVYGDEAQATMAADIVIDRINAAESVPSLQLWADIIADWDGRLEAPSVFYAEEADRYVTLITISKPLPPNERVDRRYAESGLLFRLLYTRYIRRDLAWLQPTLPN